MPINYEHDTDYVNNNEEIQDVTDAVNAKVQITNNENECLLSVASQGLIYEKSRHHDAALFCGGRRFRRCYTGGGFPASHAIGSFNAAKAA